MPNDEIVPGFDGEKDESLDIGLRAGAEKSLILTLAGRIGAYNSSAFQRRVGLAIDRGFVRLIFDCSGLSRVSATGVGAFAAILKAVRPEGGIIFLRAHPEALETFRVLGFSGVFASARSESEAELFFRASSGLPVAFPCPACGKSLDAPGPGRFRCPFCEALMSLARDGGAELG